MNKLLEIITEATKRGIACETFWQEYQMGFSVPGFSKAGEVRLLLDGENTVKVYQRYDKVDEIENFEQLVSIAWGWYFSYKERSPFENPDSRWKATFVEFGYLEEVIVTNTIYKIK